MQTPSSSLDPSPPAPALSLNERDALAILALSTNYISRSEWQQHVRAVGLRADATHALAGEAFKALVERLESARLIHVSGAGSYIVHPALVHKVLEDARSRDRLGAIAAPRLPRETYYGWNDVDERLRVGIALHDANVVGKALQRLDWNRHRPGDHSPLLKALTLHAPSSWIAQLPEDRVSELLREGLHFAATELVAPGEDFLAAASRSDDPEVRARAAITLALIGKDEAARATIPAGANGPWEAGARGIIELTCGRWTEAIAAFDRAGATKNGARRARGLPSLLAVFELLLAASPAGRAADLPGLPERLAASEALDEWPHAAEVLSVVAAYRATGRADQLPALNSESGWIDRFVHSLAARWMPKPRQAVRASDSPGSPRSISDEKALVSLRQRAESMGFAWVARQIESLGDGRELAGTLAALSSPTIAPWEIALEALSATVAGKAHVSGSSQVAAGVVWIVELVSSYPGFEEEAHEARLTARFLKTKGQLGGPVTLERLEKDGSLPLTAQDRALAASIVASRRSRRSATVPLRTLFLAVGHPRLRDAAGPLTVERGEPEVRVQETAQGARLSVFPASWDKAGLAVRHEQGRLVLYERSETAARFAHILGEGVDVPKAGVARAAETLAAIGPHVAVRGAEALGKAAGARVEPADGRLRVQLFRAGAAFRVRLRVVPGGSEGIALRPGVEPAHVLIASDKGARSVERDLAAERARAERLLEACPLLAALPADGDDRVAGDIEACLELLLELDAHRGDEVVVEWPAGDPLRAPIRRDTTALRVRVAGEAQWLGVDGELAIDERRVVAFTELLERASAARGRFVPLGDGDYLALTDKLREQLDTLGRVRALADRQGRASLAMLPAIVHWADGADLELGSALRERLDSLERALDATPRVPRALQAELRDYQSDGFVFLARRASCGLGSCLADDMGLGKTVQALALLLARAKAGPAIVVAPTSVCRNWEDEARRFAPSLTLHRLSSAPDRAACVAGLGAGDVLLASYGLLGTSSDALGARRFATAVFDEAHALKNPDTRRAAGARAVAADAIVGLTGTPLENHLGELHALFDVLMPGLLGARDRFERVFAGPIARGDKRATAQLRSLVRPFLLRRTKAQVLDELPDKTEVTRVIGPSEEERAFYEALRRRALARVQEATEAKGNQARILVLAEITKLRRAAVDPRLVGGDDAPPGSKLEALGELVRELREEGHRALVFSQFLEVLDRAGAKLEAQGARCVRLDGTMSADARAAAVEAFQSGLADVFLLSLRAGGVGMNLTAADYVIHLDPWWNPAVEDQATDRAHRIGQSRAVTVVRLVTEGTIEEKVLKLHAAKRALYADAIGELDGATKLDLREMVGLLSA